MNGLPRVRGQGWQRRCKPSPSSPGTPGTRHQAHQAHITQVIHISSHLFIFLLLIPFSQASPSWPSWSSNHRLASTTSRGASMCGPHCVPGGLRQAAPPSPPRGGEAQSLELPQQAEEAALPTTHRVSQTH